MSDRINQSASEIPGEVAEFLQASFGSAWSARSLHGDASVRRYFRVEAEGKSLILAYYPEEVRESLERFLRAHATLSSTRVPAIVSRASSMVLQSDVGDRTLFALLKDDRDAAVPLYREAVNLLLDFQQAGGEATEINPPFDARKFRDELAMTGEFYVEQLSGSRRSEKLNEIFDAIATDLVSHPYVLCHRDYHGENIHIYHDALFVIDFQDLRSGPDTYDLASLLRDRGAGELLGDQLELQLIEEYGRLTGAAGDLRSRYFRNLLQRSLKAIGTFAKQALTRDRTHYLAYIPPTLRAIERALAEVPEYDSLRAHFPMTFASAPSAVRKGVSP